MQVSPDKAHKLSVHRNTFLHTQKLFIKTINTYWTCSKFCPQRGSLPSESRL